MLYHKRKRWVFVAAGRCACRSIHHALRHATEFEANDIFLDTPEWEIYHRHSPAFAIRDKLGHDVWNECYSFAVVRNPYHWVASRFWHGVASGSREYPPLGRMRLKDFRSVLDKASFPSQLRGMEWITHRQQYPFLADRNGVLIVKEVFRLEELSETWPYICDKLGVPRVKLRKYNRSERGKSNRPAYSDYLEPGTRDFVWRHFRNDFVRFGYSRGDL